MLSQACTTKQLFLLGEVGGGVTAFLLHLFRVEVCRYRFSDGRLRTKRPFGEVGARARERDIPLAYGHLDTLHGPQLAVQNVQGPIDFA